MIRPCRAAVVPRVVDPETQEYVPIDEKILEYYHAKIRTVRLVGHGKTTALEHLADALVDYPGIVLLDEHAFLNPLQYFDAKLIVFFSRCKFKADVRLTLAPWTRDDVIEFLLAKHPARCKPVMARLLAADDGWLTDGDPRLWALVLGIMADDDEVDSVEDALRKKISTVLDGGSLSDFVVATCLKHVGKHQLFESDLEELKPLLETEVFKLLGCPGARLILDADQICEAIKNRRTLECFEQPWPERLYELVAKKFRWNSGEMVWLSQIASLHENKAAAVAASLMFKIDKSWKPESPGPFWYVGARLKNAG